MSAAELEELLRAARECLEGSGATGIAEAMTGVSDAMAQLLWLSMDAANGRFERVAELDRSLSLVMSYLMDTRVLLAHLVEQIGKLEEDLRS